jgi:hypothetical protein
MRKLMLRLGATLALASGLAVTALPAAAHPTVEVGNPQPYDRVIPGSLVMHGVAYDHDARQGTGVDQVSIFICPRGEGGQYLGEASLGMPSNMPTPAAQFASAGWVFKTPALKGAADERTLCVFARSSVTGTETLVRVPITIGDKPPRHTEDAVGPAPQPGPGSPTPPGTLGTGAVSSTPGAVGGSNSVGGAGQSTGGEEGGPEE